MSMTPPETTLFDQPGAAGYDLAQRFEHVKMLMRRVEFHGHLETSQLRDAVLGSRRRKRHTSHTRRLSLRPVALES